MKDTKKPGTKVYSVVTTYTTRMRTGQNPYPGFMTSRFTEGPKDYVLWVSDVEQYGIAQAIVRAYLRTHGLLAQPIEGD